MRSCCIQPTMPGLMCNILAISSRNVCQCDRLKKQAAPVEAKEFLSLEVVEEESLDEELITSATQWQVGSTFEEIDIEVREEFPGMRDPAVCNQLSKLFAVRSEKGCTQTEFQFCSFNAHPY